MADEKAISDFSEEEIFNAAKNTELYAKALNAHGKLIIEQQSKDIFGKAQGEAYGNMDAVFKEVLGIEKESSTKTTAQMRELLSELKTFRESKDKDGNDIQTALEKQKKQHELDFAKAQETIQSLEKKTSELLKSGEKRDITMAISKELQDRKFKAHYSESDIKGLNELKLNKILSNSKIEDGNIVFYDEKGNKRTNNKGVVMTAKEIVESDYSDMFEVKSPGGGADANGKITTILENGKVVMDRSKIKNRVEFNQEFESAMSKKGVASHEKEYTESYKEAMQEYGYNDLPYS